MKKRVISILLAAVMVVLLLPLAAVSVSADDPYHAKWDFTTLTPNNGQPAEGETTSNISDSLPTGWIATTDNESTWWTSLNYEKIGGSEVQVNNGVRLGGAGQGIALTNAAGVPERLLNGESSYTIQVKYNTTFKFDRFCWNFSTTIPEAATFSSASTNGQFRYAGGPNGDAFSNNGEDAYNFNLGANPTVGANLIDYSTGATLTNAGVKALLGQGMKEGRQVTNTYEIVSGNLAALYVTVDGATLKLTPKSTLAAKGYFCIWQSGWGANNVASVQSVEIQEGTFSSSMLPVANGTNAVASSGAIGSAAPYVYSTDFTKLTPDAGTRNTINDSLPVDWVAKYDTHAITENYVDGKTTGRITTAINYEMNHSSWKDSQTNNGVRLGGANQGIMMTAASNLPTEIVDATVDYTLTVKWNTTHKFQKIAFGWSSAPTSRAYYTSSIANTYVQYYYSGGPSNSNAFTNGSDANCGKISFTGSNSDFSSKIYNENGEAIAREEILALQGDGAKAGHQVTTTFEIVGGKLIAVYNTIDGVTVKYCPESDYTVTGYFGCQLIGWGDNNAASIQSVEIREGSLATFKGVQNTEADGENRQKIRLVATVGSSDFDYLGFNVSYQVGDGDTTVRLPQYCQYVYTSIQGDGNTYTASNLGGRYIYALSMEGVPTNAGTVTFTVSTFAKKGDVTYRGPSYEVVYENGAFVSGTQVSADA